MTSPHHTCPRHELSCFACVLGSPPPTSSWWYTSILPLSSRPPSPRYSRRKPRPLPLGSAYLTSVLPALRGLWPLTLPVPPDVRYHNLRHRNSRQDLSPSPDRRARWLKPHSPRAQSRHPDQMPTPTNVYWNSMQNLKPIAIRLY